MISEDIREIKALKLHGLCICSQVTHATWQWHFQGVLITFTFNSGYVSLLNFLVNSTLTQLTVIQVSINIIQYEK